MNTVLLRPTDVLFFRDGRPMEGSLSGHGAAWPLPNVTDLAFHAALHRSGLKCHGHDQIHGVNRVAKDCRKFGSLVTAGPFPVRCDPGDLQTWFFPRPQDLLDNSVIPALHPTRDVEASSGSLPAPLKFAVGNRLPPSKDSSAKGWISTAAFERYLNGGTGGLASNEVADDSDFADREHSIGIEISDDTGTTGTGDTEGKIYSAQYLRLRDTPGCNWRLGVLAATAEKIGSDGPRQDLIPQLIREDRQLLVGGQQRICTAEIASDLARLPLPMGKSDGFQQRSAEREGPFLVKWVLLSPAIWPEIPSTSHEGKPMNPHPGGWLPNWIALDWDPEQRQVRANDSNGSVLLVHRKIAPRRIYSGARAKRDSSGATRIRARLVAAIVPKPIPVTGWALPNPDGQRPEAGAKSTHFAVPAGAVYYFEAETAEDARNLASALNWHGAGGGTSICNRRSTLMGEKGFGLGVCGTWTH